MTKAFKTSAILLFAVLLHGVTCRAEHKDTSQPRFIPMKWEHLPDLNVPRSGHRFFVANGEMVVVGGHTDGFVRTATAEYFKNGEWHRIKTIYPHDLGFSLGLGNGDYLIGGGCADDFGIGPFESVKKPSQNRSSPFIFTYGKDEAVIFGSLGSWGESLTPVVDRLHGEPFVSELLSEWLPISDCNISYPDKMSVTDPETGRLYYLFRGSREDGAQAVISFSDGEFSLVKTDHEIPVEGPWGPIVWCQSPYIDSIHGVALMPGIDEHDRVYLLALDYSPMFKGEAAPIKVFYTHPMKRVVDAPALILPDGRFVAAGGYRPGDSMGNYNPLAEVVAFYPFEDEGLDRKDLLVALGGGVVGDLTGFVAATYLRGIDFIQVPTTLLAQADSSVGGKTGVDFDGYKNMVGAFKMPRLVYMNFDVLKTLDDRQYFAGFAEIMKYGLIKDAEFYAWLIENMYEICERDVNVLSEMLMRSCTIKKLVVEKDPTEQGERAILNLGHTIGHAIEKAKNFELLHGECVALGTVAAAYVSWKKEMLSMEEYYEIRDMFVPFYLPISIDGIDPQEILKLTKSDKKKQGDSIKFILLKKIGKAVIDTTVTDEEILAAVKEIYFDDEAND